MSKQSFKPATNQAGERLSVAASAPAGGGGAYQIIPPAYYLAIVESIEAKFFTANGKDYQKITPQFVLLNDNNTRINRQDLTVGYWDTQKKALYHPEGEFPVWGGNNGARYLFSAMGIFRETEDEVLYEFVPQIVKDRAIKVRTSIGGYVKGNNDLTRKVSSAADFTKMANEAIDDLTNGRQKVYGLEDIPDIIEWFNDKYCVGEEKLQTKNVLTGFYPVSDEDLEVNGWYRDGDVYLYDGQEYTGSGITEHIKTKGERIYVGSGSVFTSEASFRWYQNALAEGTGEEDLSNNGGW